MAFILKDRVQQLTTTTGTGPYTLSTSVPGYQAFSAVASVGDTFWGTILLQGGDWLTGLFTYSAANQVTVTEVYESSNSNTAVTFGVGVKSVFIDLPASRGQSGARKQRSVTASPIVIVSSDQVINFNINAGSPTCVVPTYTGRNGVPLTFKDAGAQAAAHPLTITFTGGEKADNQSTVTISTNYGEVTLTPYNDGTNTGWKIS